MYSPNLVSKLNDIADEYQQKLLQSLTAILSQQKFRNTGKGLSSLKVDVVRGTSTKAPQLIVRLDDSLIYLDKRRLQWTKHPKMRPIIEWALTKSFARVPGYKAIAAVTPKHIQRVAWAVAVDKKNNDTWRAKPWRRQALSAVLKEMNRRILADFDRAIEEDFITTIQNSN